MHLVTKYETDNVERQKTKPGPIMSQCNGSRLLILRHWPISVAIRPSVSVLVKTGLTGYEVLLKVSELSVQ